MGLLTSDKSSRPSPLFLFLQRHGNRASLLLYVSGLLTFALFASEYWCDRTYFSDNALLPGLANREFTLPPQTDSLLQQLQQESSKRHDELPVAAVERVMRRIGLEVSLQNFTLNHPLTSKPVTRALAPLNPLTPLDRYSSDKTSTASCERLVRRQAKLWS